MRVRLISRDVMKYPARVRETQQFRNDVEIWWGDKAIPKGYVAIFDLGERIENDSPIDMRGALRVDDEGEKTASPKPASESHEAASTTAAAAPRSRRARKVRARQKRERSSAGSTGSPQPAPESSTRAGTRSAKKSGHARSRS